MTDIIEFMDDLGTFMVMVVMLYGATVCFFGYKLFRFQVAFLGFLVGAILGYGGGFLGSGEETVAALTALVLGILGGWLAYTFYLLSVFLNNFALSTFGLGVLAGLNGGDVFSEITVVGGLIVGVLSLFFVKPIIIITTGLSGGLTTGASIATLLGMGKFGILLGVIMGSFGVFFQFKNESKGVHTQGQHPDSTPNPENTSPSMGEMAQKAKEMGSNVKQAATTAYTSDTANNLRQKAKEVGGNVKQAANQAYTSDTANNLRQKAKEVQASATNAIQSHTSTQCPHCGKAISGNSAFCGGCGNPVQK